MKESSFAYAIYWRNSLADAELGSGALKLKNVEGFLPLQKREVAIGRVGNTTVEKYFADEAEGVRTVEVVLRPKVYRSRLEHGYHRSSGTPDVVTPSSPTLS